MTDRDEAIRGEVDRILQSDIFRASGGLRRLLQFLADKVITGEADLLKEYSVGVDGLGRPSTYDPQRDPSVRIQMGRLREKLAAYYREAGKDDPLIVELPKGHYKLTVSPRVCAPEIPVAAEIVPPVAAVPAEPQGRRWQTIVLGAGLVVALVWGSAATLTLNRERAAKSAAFAQWTPSLEELWRPFLAEGKSLIVSYENSPFAEFKGEGKFADKRFFFGGREFVKEDQIAQLPELDTLRRELGDGQRLTNVFLAPTGEISALFIAARLIYQHTATVSLVRSSDLSWQQLADHNVLYIGDPKFFASRLSNLPVSLDLSQTPEGIQNRRPQAGELPFLADHFPTGYDFDGEVYGLITRAPGPLQTTDVMSFTGNRSPGYLAAVQSFVTEHSAEAIVRNLKHSKGKIPRYYQVVLKVKFRDGIPVDTTYILYHELTAKAPTE